MFIKRVSANLTYDSVYFLHCTQAQERHFLEILFNPYATKNDRLFLVGRMKYFGYTQELIFGYIDRYNRWKDYNKEITKHNIENMFRCAGKNDYPSNEPPAHALSDDDLVALFFKNTKPWHVAPLQDIKQAALYYSGIGAHVIPMRRVEKLPLVKWKEFQERQPTLSEISKWDWRHGIILLGTSQYCFLDVDIKSAKHPNGVESFDESILDGRHFERTPSGGYHIFGKGSMKSRNGNGIEIIGKGRYIVTCPTPGYTAHTP